MSDYLDEVPAALIELARRAELGYHNQRIRGAVVVLQFEKDVTTHVLGSLGEIELYGICVNAILQTFAHLKEAEAMEAAEGLTAMFQKQGKEEH